MQHLETLWKLINVAGSVRDIAQDTRTYHFNVRPNITLYIHTEHSTMSLRYHDKPEVEIQALFTGGFGWRVQVEQDEAGVYVVAKRRSVIGTLSRAQFQVRLPYDAYCVLKVENGTLEWQEVNQEVHIAPRTAQTPMIITQP